MATIITNGHERNLLSWYELSRNEQREFEDDTPIDEELKHEADYVRYKGNVYNVNADFVIAPEPLDWDGIIQDTFFSGILIRFSTDGDRVVMGRYYS